jgi:hypothetical protein
LFLFLFLFFSLLSFSSFLSSKKNRLCEKSADFLSFIKKSTENNTVFQNRDIFLHAPLSSSIIIIIIIRFFSSAYNTHTTRNIIRTTTNQYTTMASKKLAQTIAHSSKEGTTTTTTKNVISQTLKKVAPWKITGPASDPEWQNVPVSAEDYRARAPASFPHENVKIPNSEPDRVFNVRYYPRDARRAFEPVLHGREKVKTTYTLSPTENVLGAKEWDERLGNDIKRIDPRDFFPGRRDTSQDYALKSSGYRAVPLLENPGGGYTQL